MKIWGISIFIALFLGSSFFAFHHTKGDTIKIGLLYSKTGTMATEESAIAKVVRYGVDEINQEGGILDKKIEIIEYDGGSNPDQFKKGAEFIIEKGADVIFGCWTSSSRKAVKEVVEKYNKILFYPIQYEGAEESKNIIYLGATPNQQINPLINFIKNNYGDKIYLVGSDYIYPRMANFYINSISKYVGLNVVGEDYSYLNGKDFEDIIANIKEKKPNVIINTINGSSNIAFFQALKDGNITSKEIPVFSLSLDENSLHTLCASLGEDALVGHYAIWSYFNSISTKENRDFKAKLKSYLGDDFILSDGAYATYLGIKIWKENVKIANSTKADDILLHLQKYSTNSLSGIVYLNKNHHTDKMMRIGKIGNGSDFNVVWDSNTLIPANPFPSFKEKLFWEQKEVSLYKQWNGKWEATKGGKDE